MTRAWVLMLALACAWGPTAAHAQGNGWSGFLDLPLVVKEGGWARYAATTDQGEPAEVVVKVGPAERHKGKMGRWIIVEADVPEVGRVVLEFLVVGKLFTAKNLVKARARMPGQPAEEAEPTHTGAEPYTPKELRKGREQIDGRTVSITEYAFPGGMTATWSPDVPGLGITRTTGPESMRLVAFGVGGDSWKGAATKPLWPVDSSKRPRE